MTDKPLLTLDDIWELKRYAHDHETLCYAVQRTVLSRQAEQSASAPTVRPPVHSYTENGQALYTGESVAMLIANALRASASATSVRELTFNAFRQANVARCIKWHPDGIESWSPSEWLTAVTGELGELASLLKMRNRERDGLMGNKFSPTDKMVADELADVMTYLDLLAAVLGVNLGTAVVSKFNEVSERVGFPDRIALASAPTPAQESRPQGHNPEGEHMKPGTFVLVRTYSAGVHFGTLAKQDGKLVTLTTARRIWSWKGANTLNEIASNGVGKSSRISNPVPEIELTEAIELIPVSDEARTILENVGWTK